MSGRFLHAGISILFLFAGCGEKKSDAERIRSELGAAFALRIDDACVVEEIGERRARSATRAVFYRAVIEEDCWNKIVDSLPANVGPSNVVIDKRLRDTSSHRLDWWDPESGGKFSFYLLPSRNLEVPAELQLYFSKVKSGQMLIHLCASWEQRLERETNRPQGGF